MLLIPPMIRLDSFRLGCTRPRLAQFHPASAVGLDDADWSGLDADAVELWVPAHCDSSAIPLGRSAAVKRPLPADGWVIRAVEMNGAVRGSTMGR